MKNYKELFEKEFNKSQKIDETFAKICNEQGFRKGIENFIDKFTIFLDKIKVKMLQ